MMYTSKRKPLMRLTSLLLCLVMALGLLPVSAMAAEAERQNDLNELEEQYLEQVLSEQVLFQLDGLGAGPVSDPPVAGDVLEVDSIGGVDVTRTDALSVPGYGAVPVVEAGDFTDYMHDGGSSHTRMPLTLSRPKGADAGYPVSVELRALSGSIYLYNCDVYDHATDGTDPLSQIVIPAGQSQVTVYLDLQGYSLASKGEGPGSFYLQFYNAHRTEVDYPFIQVLLKREDTEFNEPFDEGDTSLYSVTTSNATNAKDTILGMPVPILVQMNSESSHFITTGNGTSLTLGGQTLTPGEPEGSVSTRPSFLYMPTAEDIGEDDGSPALTFGGKTAAVSLHDYTDDTVKNMGTPRPSPGYIYYAKPEYGTVSLDQSGPYPKLGTVQVTVPLLNAGIVEAAGQYPLDDQHLGDWFGLTLDGGTHLVLSDLTYDRQREEIHASFVAPQTEGTYYLEVVESEGNIDTLIYGARTTFQVGEQQSAFVPVESVTIGGLPDSNRFSVEDIGETHPLTARVAPDNATFQDITWTSSDPSVASFSAGGQLTCRSTGVTTLTATVQGEVNYRTDNDLEANPNTSASVTVYVGMLNPALYDGSSGGKAIYDFLIISLNDNFDRVVPQGEIGEDIYESLTYDVKIYLRGETDWEEQPCYSTSEMPIGRNQSPAYIYADGSRYLRLNLSDDSGGIPKQVSTYDATGEKLPAYKVEVNARFTHDYLAQGQDMTATYYGYMNPEPMRLDNERVPFFGHGSVINGQTPSWRDGLIHYVPSDFTKVGYFAIRLLPQGGYSRVDSQEVVTPESTDKITFVQDRQSGYTVSIAPPDLKWATILGEYRLTYYVEDPVNGRSEWSFPFTVSNAADLMSQYYNGRRVYDGGTVFDGTSSELRILYNAMTDSSYLPETQQAFLAALESAVPAGTLQLDAPASFGLPIVNGVAQSSNVLNVQFPADGEKHPVTIRYPGSSAQVTLYGEYWGDAYTVFEVPKAFHDTEFTIYEYTGSNKVAKMTVIPYEGRFAVRSGQLTAPLRFECEKDDKTYAGMLYTIDQASLTGGPEKVVIYPAGATGPAAGTLSTNYVEMREKATLLVNLPEANWDTSQIHWRVVDASGSAVQGADGSQQISGAGVVEVDYSKVVETPTCRLIVEHVESGKSSALYIFDYQRLQALSNNFQRNAVPLSLHGTEGVSADYYITDTETGCLDPRNGVEYNIRPNNKPKMVITLPATIFAPGTTPQQISLFNTRPEMAETLTGTGGIVYFRLGYDMTEAYRYYQTLNDATGIGAAYRTLDLTVGGTKIIDFPIHVTTHDYKMIDLYAAVRRFTNFDDVGGADFEHVVDNGTTRSGGGISGEAADILKDFEVDIPIQGTPFTFHVAKKGNEYVIRGVAEVSVLPDGGTASTLSDLARKGEEAFNKVYDRLRKSVNDAEDEQSDTKFEIMVGGEAFVGFIGYIEARGFLDPATGTVTIAFQEGGIVGEISGEYRQKMSLAFGEVAFKIDFSTSVTMKISMPSEAELAHLKYPDEAKINLSLGSEISAGLDLRAGIGINLFILKLSVGVGGEFRLSAGTEHIQRPYSGVVSDGVGFTGSTKLYCYTSVGILWFEITKKYTLFYGEINKAYPDNATNPFSDSYQYKEDTRTMFRFAQMSSLMLDYRLVTGDSANKVKDGLGQASGAGYAAGGGALYVMPDTDYNGYRLMLGDDAVDDTSCGDFGFDAASNDTTTLVAWERIPETIKVDPAVDDPNAVMLSYLGKTEIYAAVKTDGGWTPQRLTDNQRMDMTPVTAVNNSGDGIVVWSQGSASADASGELSGLTADTELRYARYDAENSQWTTGLLLSGDEERPIAGYSVALDDKDNALVAVSYQDEDLSSIEYVHLAGASGGENAPAENTVTLYRDGRTGLNPQVMADDNGFHVAYYGEEPSAGNGAPRPVVYYSSFPSGGFAATQPLRIDAPVSPNLKLLAADGGPVLAWTASLVTPGDAPGQENAVNQVLATKLITSTTPIQPEANQPANQADEGDTPTALTSITALAPKALGQSAYPILTFDARTDGEVVEVLALLADLVDPDYDNSATSATSAELYEFSGTFENGISVNTDFDYGRLTPGGELPIRVVVQNQGYQDVTKVTIGGIEENPKTFEGLTLKPGATQTFTLYHTLPGWTEEDSAIGKIHKKAELNNLTASVTASFSGHGTKMETAAVKLQAADLAVALAPITTQDQVESRAGGQSLTLQVVERSGFALPSGAGVTLGVYADAGSTQPIAVVSLSEDEIAALNKGLPVAKTFEDLPQTENTAVFGATSFAAKGTAVWELNPSDNAVTAVLNARFTQRPDEPEIPDEPEDPEDPEDSNDSDHNGGGSTSQVLAESSVNGTVTVSPKNAAKGTTVTVTPRPHAGYEVDRVTVTDGKGSNVPVMRQANGTYTFTMPASKVSVSVTFRATAWENPFTDVGTGDWFYEAVRYAHQNGLFAGTGDTTFSPGSSMSRAMLVTVLWSMAGRPAAGSGSFSDVPVGTWYGEAVAWAAENGIVSGYGDGLFGPDDGVTREQMAVILYHYADRPAANGVLNQFTDADRVSSFAADAMRWAVEQGIISGKGSGLLDPKGSATRAEVAAMLMQFVTTR